MKVYSVSTFTFNGSTGENPLSAVKKHAQKHKKAYVGLGALGAAAAWTNHVLNKDAVNQGHYEITGIERTPNGIPLDSPIGYVPKMEWTDDPTWYQKLQLKIREAFKIDSSSKVPEGVDVTDKYLRDGYNYITTEYGLVPNPWYSEEAANKAVNNIGSIESLTPSMDKFLKQTHLNGDITIGAIDGLSDGIDAGCSSGIITDNNGIVQFDPNGYHIPDFTGLTSEAQEAVTDNILSRIINTISDLLF